MNKTLLYQGSVKNLYEAGEDIIFEYSDRYSLFDWGEMPDQLSHKGEALATMGALFFNLMSQAEIPHHFLGLVNEDGTEVKNKPSRLMKVKKVPVFRPTLTSLGYDYSFYASKPQSGLVPLEVIFRFGIGAASSLLPRVAQDPSLLKQWNLTSLKVGDVFDFPLIDFSTKLEKSDRSLTFAQARSIAGLSETEFFHLMAQTRKVALMIKDTLNQLGIELWDGKIEWAFTPGVERSFMLVDSIGLDELRLEKNGVSLSKEMLREYYRTTPWFESLQAAKKQGSDFKQFCATNPDSLPTEVKKAAEDLYTNFASDLSGLVLGKTISFGEKK